LQHASALQSEDAAVALAASKVEATIRLVVARP
jgi:hypothetical protein